MTAFLPISQALWPFFVWQRVEKPISLQQKRMRIMKKKTFAIALFCSMTLTSFAQIYGYDSWAELPTTSVYDQGLMNMHLRALSQMAARREEIEARKSEIYQYYGEMALDALQDKEWGNVIRYVDKALETGHYCGELYYMRGYANEQLGYTKDAKADYKKGKKCGSSDCADALNRLNQKEKNHSGNVYFSK